MPFLIPVVTTIAGFFGITVSAAVATQIAVSIALTAVSFGASLVARLLSGGKRMEALDGPTRTIKSEVVPVRWILGAKVRTPGVLCYFGSRDREARMALILSEGACEKIDNLIWIDGQAVKLARTTRSTGDKLTPVAGKYKDYIEIYEYFKADGAQGADMRYEKTPISGETWSSDDTNFNETFPTHTTLFHQYVDQNNEEVTEPFRTHFPDWTENHKLDGVSWVYVKLTQPEYQDLNDRVWTRVPNLEFRVNGLKINWPGLVTTWATATSYSVGDFVSNDSKDWRSTVAHTSTAANKPTQANSGGSNWVEDPSPAASTENAAAIRHWWETVRRGRPASAIDSTDFTAAYNLCDQAVTVTLPSGYSGWNPTSKRYTINGVFSAGDDVSQVEDQLDAAWAGEVIESRGKLHFRPGKDSQNAIQTITDSDIIEPPVIKPWPALQERVNAISGEIPQSDEHDWTKLSLPEIPDPIPQATLTRDGGKRSGHVRLAYLTHPIAAGRLLATNLRRSQESLRLEMVVRPGNSFQRTGLIPTDRVLVTNSEYGLSSTRMEVERVLVQQDGSVALTLREDVSGTYADTLVLPPAAPRVIRLPEAGDVPAVEGLAVEEFAEIATDGAVTVGLLFSWTAAAVSYTEVRVREKPNSGDPPWTLGTSTTAEFRFRGVTVGKTYQIQARHRNHEDVAGAWSVLEHTVGLDPDFEPVPVHDPAPATGADDDAPRIQGGLDAVSASGGGLLVLPVGDYRLKSKLTIPSKVVLRGHGPRTRLIRGAAIPSADGLINFSGQDSGLEDLTIDGGVTTAVGITTGPGVGELFETAGINGNPTHAVLSDNSSLRIKSGAKRIHLSGVDIEHTGGYAVWLDASTSNVEDIRIEGSLFRNNRPHFFGPLEDEDYDLRYGGSTTAPASFGSTEFNALTLLADRDPRTAYDITLSSLAQEWTAYLLLPQGQNFWSIKDGNGNEILDQFTDDEITISGTAYHRYYLTGQAADTDLDLTVVISGDDDTNYGAWTGGIFASGDGSNYAVRGLLVSDCSFSRMGGNAVWSWASAFGAYHDSISVVGSTFSDLCLDGVQMGVVHNFAVTGNTFHRVGYQTTTDTDSPTPKYDAGRYAVAIDCAGHLTGVISGNSVRSVNGGSIDLDGLAEGVVSNNTCVIPDSSDPDYANDSIASYGTSNANLTRGINLGRTYSASGARRLVIADNTLVNQAGGGISLNASRDVLVQGNAIIQPVIAGGNAEFGPIVLSNRGSAASERTSGCTIRNNQIYLNAAGHWAIRELDTLYGTTNNFQSEDRNQVLGNRVSGTHKGEFKRSPNSSSVSGVEISTNDSAVDQIEQSIIAQEGSGTTAALKVYKNVAGTGTQLLQVQFSNGALQVGGTAGSGLLLTGDKTDSFAGDTVFSGHLVADAFLALKDHGDGDSTYDDDNADLLDDSWGLLRWSKTDDRWEQSVEVDSSDERVWEAFKVVAAGADKQLQFNDDGAVAGDANLTWNKTLKQLAVAGVDATAAIAVSEGYVQSADGFYTTATEGNAIQAPNGGFTGKYCSATDTAWNALQASAGGVRSEKAFYPKSLSTAPTNPGSGYSGWSHKSGDVWRYYKTGTGAGWKEIDLSVLDGSGNGDFTTLKISSTAENALDMYTSGSGSTSGGGIDCRTIGAYQNVVYAIEAVNGGVKAGKAFYPKSLSSAPTAPTSSYSGWSHKSGHIWRYYKTGSGAGWKEIDLSVLDGSGNGDFTTLKTSSTAVNALDMYASGSGATSGGGIQCRAIAAYQNVGNAIQAPNGGFTGKYCSATDTAWNALQASAGGVRSEKAFYAKSLSSAPTNPGSGYSGWGHKSGHIWRYYKTGSGAGWKEIDLSVLDGSGNGDFTTLKISSTAVNALDMYASGSGATSGGGIQCRAIAAYQNVGNAIQAPNGGFTGKYCSATDTAWNALQASAGGVRSEKAFYPKSLSTAPTNPGSGYGGIAHKTGSTYWFWDGSAWISRDVANI